MEYLVGGRSVFSVFFPFVLFHIISLFVENFAGFFSVKEILVKLPICTGKFFTKKTRHNFEDSNLSLSVCLLFHKLMTNKLGFAFMPGLPLGNKLISQKPRTLVLYCIKI